MPRLRSAAAPGGQLALTGVLAIGQLAGRGSLALALLVLIRELSPARFGDLALALSLVAILATVADAGFSRLIVRDAARAGAMVAPVVRRLLRLRLGAVAVVVLLAAAAVAAGTTPFALEVGLLAVAYLALESVAVGFEHAAAGAERPWRFVVAQVAGAVALLGGVAALAAADAVTLASALTVLAAGSAAKVGGHLLAWRGGARDARAEPPDGPRAVFASALPFLGLALIATAYYRIGLIALYAIHGAEETASYAAALRIVDVIAIVAGLSFLGASPALSRMHRDRPAEIWLTWRRSAARVAIAAVPCALLVALVAEPLCGALFGAAYRTSSAADLRLLLPGAVFMVVQSVSAAAIFMSDDHRAVLRLGLMTLTVCALLSVGLSAAYGSTGAAIAMSVAELISFTTFALLLRHRHRHRRVADAGPASPARPDRGPSPRRASDAGDRAPRR